MVIHEELKRDFFLGQNLCILYVLTALLVSDMRQYPVSAEWSEIRFRGLPAYIKRKAGMCTLHDVGTHRELGNFLIRIPCKEIPKEAIERFVAKR